MKEPTPPLPRLSDDFCPLPLLGNAHLQTVLASWLPVRGAPVADRRHEVVLPDGDRLLLHDHEPPGWRPGDAAVLLVHGLGGSARSGYMLRLTRLLLPHGVRVVRMDLRGSGEGVALARGSYNAACSDDVRAVAEEIGRWAPESPLALVGFSLGGNVVLKLAGEATDRPLPNLARVAAVAPPIDLVGCSEVLGWRRNVLYNLHFVRGLLAQLRQQRRHFPDLPVVRFPRWLSLLTFDELYTAPRGGFASALDYYRRASALPLIPRIQVPALILTARDDPFIPAAPFETLTAPPHIEVRIMPRGGHVGFLGWDGAGGVRWVERRVAEWLLGR
jgi:predicted alpha/beta-fold hydrolase